MDARDPPSVRPARRRSRRLDPRAPARRTPRHRSVRGDLVAMARTADAGPARGDRRFALGGADAIGAQAARRADGDPARRCARRIGPRADRVARRHAHLAPPPLLDRAAGTRRDVRRGDAEGDRGRRAVLDPAPRDRRPAGGSPVDRLGHASPGHALARAARCPRRAAARGGDRRAQCDRELRLSHRDDPRGPRDRRHRGGARRAEVAGALLRFGVDRYRPAVPSRRLGPRGRS